MRLLFLTNFYPPASRGGYELWCQEVAIGLRNKGHFVEVLTSDYNLHLTNESDPEWVYRELHLEMEIASLQNSLLFFTSRKRREKENRILLKKRISIFKPDFILVWGMWNLERSLPALAEKLLPGQIVYYTGDYWPILPSQFENYWQVNPRNRFAKFPKKLMAALAKPILSREETPKLLFEHMLFPTKFLRSELARKGIRARNYKIIYGAVDTSLYNSLDNIESLAPGNARLLFVGRLSPDKGIHTAIEAVSKLVHQNGFHSLKLSIVGTGDKDYESFLKETIQKERIESWVTFLGSKTKEDMPEIYQKADIFLFTSIWQEPFGRVLIEAMASRLAVIGTAVGGAAEILIDNENALLYPPGDSDILADQIKKLIESPDLRNKLASNGHRHAVDNFDIHNMVDGIEDYLLNINL